MLLLVRHAMPLIDPAADPAAWPLSAAGVTAARALAGVIPAGALLVASDEPKAGQTLDPDGSRPVRRDRRLGEVRRSEAFSDDFRLARRSYVSGSEITGWEPREQVALRFGAAVRDAAAHARALSRDAVICSHGLAMTVWLSEAVFLGDPGEFWAQLRFPDLLAVDLAARSMRRLETS